MDETGLNNTGEQRKNTKEWLKPWQFKPGVSGNLSGRPKGVVSLKEYAKRMIQEMNDEEKLEFMKGIDKDFIWEMSEGRAQSNTDITTDGKPLSINIIKYGEDNPTTS